MSMKGVSFILGFEGGQSSWVLACLLPSSEGRQLRGKDSLSSVELGVKVKKSAVSTLKPLSPPRTTSTVSCFFVRFFNVVDRGSRDILVSFLA